MQTAIKAFIFGALLILPASSFARDYDHWRLARSRAAVNFEREHPRWPRVYCHTHRYPLHRDDTRKHCHNWNRNSWHEARQRWSGAYGYDRRDDYWRRDRYETARSRRDWGWNRYRD